MALAAACTSEPEPALDGTVRGMLRDDCGHADGPALYVSLDRSQAVTCADPAPGEFKLLADGRFVDSLKAGQVLEDTVSMCNAIGCAPVIYYRLEVEGLSAEGIRGILEVRELEKEVLVQKRYRAELQKCPRPVYQCG